MTVHGTFEKPKRPAVELPIDLTSALALLGGHFVPVAVITLAIPGVPAVFS
jgi:hypothetical protein